MDPRRANQQRSATQQSVLIVDQSDDSREVLRTVLAQRGLRILEASRADQGLEMARQHRPDLIVLDMELDTANPAAVSGDFAQHSHQGHTPLVVLGSARRAARPLPAEFVAKPYHYGPLIRRIEELLRA